MDDLVQWLRAQLDIDAERATAALWAGDERWRAFHREVDDRWIVEDTYDEGVAVMLEQAADGEGLARHMVAWEPVRVLREVESKRQLLDAYAAVAESDVDEIEYAHGHANGLGEAVRLLALSYTDRPGYREEWRP